MKKLLLLSLVIFASSALMAQKIMTGAESINEYLPLLQGKRIAVLSNNTGMIGKTHLVDSLITLKVNIIAIMSPEHGFRGDADAGESVSSSVDAKTGIPIRSLYGGAAGQSLGDQLKDIDILVYDLQDVGVRFYTYMTTMARMMDACAQAGKKMIILDRPNPIGFYVDGPILDMKYKNGVAWLPIPTVHGMTLGELAGMINGEKWLTNGI